MHKRCESCDKKIKTKKEFNECKKRRHELIDYLDPKDHDNKKSEKQLKKKTNKYIQTKDQRTSPKILYDFAQSKILKLVISENNSDEVYGVVSINKHVEVLNLVSARARHWLNNLHSSIDTSEIHSDDFYKTVLNSMISKAQMNGTKRVKIHNRIAQLKDEIWYDLATSDWKAIKITEDNISTISLDENSPFFSRSQSMQNQTMPKKGDDLALDKLAELLRIIPKDRLVFKVHLVALFLEAYPIPMMVFDGTTGTLKTTATASIKAIVDPNGISKEDNVSAMSEKQDDLIIQLFNRYLSSFDNVSRIDGKTSDVLCRAITGSSNPKRKLYTDKDESILNFKSKIVLNGVVPSLEHTDLQTRLIKYERISVDEIERLTEKEFNQKFLELLPYVLGKIFITLSKSLKEYPLLEKKIKPKTRMSDFEVWGEVISRVLGNNDNTFLERYHEKLKEESISAQESYPIVSSLLTFMEHRTVYEDAASSLYGSLAEIANESGVDTKSRFISFPRSSNKLTKHLKIVDSILKSCGITVQTYHYTKNDGRFTKHASIVKITKKPSIEPLDSFGKRPSPSSPSSPLQNQAQNKPKISEGTGEDPHLGNKVSSPKNTDSRHENSSGEGSEDGEDTFQRLVSQDAEKPYWICYTCNERGTEIQHVEDLSPNGLTVQSHQNAGHSIIFLTKYEAKLVRDYQKFGGLKPDVLRNR